MALEIQVTEVGNEGRCSLDEGPIEGHEELNPRNELACAAQAGVDLFVTTTIGSADG